MSGLNNNESNGRNNTFSDQEIAEVAQKVQKVQRALTTSEQKLAVLGLWIKIHVAARRRAEARADVAEQALADLQPPPAAPAMALVAPSPRRGPPQLRIVRGGKVAA